MLTLALVGVATGQDRELINVEARFVDSVTGAPVPGVEVEIENQGTGLTRTYTVDAWGRLRVFGLPAGSYVLRVSDPGPFHDFPEPNAYPFNESVNLGTIALPSGGVVVSGPGNSGGDPDEDPTMNGYWFQVSPVQGYAYQGFGKDGRWWRCPSSTMDTQSWPLTGPLQMRGPVCVFFLGVIPEDFAITFSHPGVTYRGIRSVASATGASWSAVNNGNGTITATLTGGSLSHDGGPVFDVLYQKSTPGPLPLFINGVTPVGQVTELKDGVLIPLPTVRPDEIERMGPHRLRDNPPIPPGPRRNRR